MNNEKVTNFFLTLFYIFIIGGIAVGGYYFFDIQTKRNSEINLKEESIDLKNGDTYKIEIDKNQKNSEITWESSNSELVSVDSNGKLTVDEKGSGTVTITATTQDGQQDFVEVKVEPVEQNIKVTGIKLDKNSLTMKYGQKTKIAATVFPTNASNKQISWSSSNPALVEVDEKGNLITKENISGEVIITALTIDGNYQATTKVKVEPVTTVKKVTNVKINETTGTLKYGDKKKLTVSITPKNATNKNVRWNSSDTSLVTIDNNGNLKVVGNRNGEAIITVTTVDGNYKATTKVKVAAIKVNAIKLNKTSLTLKYGESAKVTATISPSNAANKNITWTSSNPALVKVDNDGTIKVIANISGKVTVTAKTQDGAKTAKVTVTTKKTNIKTTGIKLNASSGTVYLNSNNKSVTLTATVSPSNATNKAVTWSSNNTSVATVSNGTVTAQGQGTAIISATTENGGHVAKYTITVKKKVIVVVTASQGARMNDYLKSYTSANGYKYTISDKSLKYVYKSGSGFDYQLGEGYNGAKKFINDNYSSKKKYTDISLFFTLTGNSVRKSTCKQIENNTTNPTYTEIAQGYSTKVSELSGSGYTIQGYVISHAPLQSKHKDASKHFIVYSTNPAACDAGKRSGWKYLLSNEKMISVIKDYPNLKFVDNFSNFIKVKSRKDKTFTWLRTYTTTDSLHWDEATTIDYMTMAFNTSGM